MKHLFALLIGLLVLAGCNTGNKQVGTTKVYGTDGLTLYTHYSYGLLISGFTERPGMVIRAGEINVDVAKYPAGVMTFEYNGMKPTLQDKNCSVFYLDGRFRLHELPAYKFEPTEEEILMWEISKSVEKKDSASGRQILTTIYGSPIVHLIDSLEQIP